MNTHLTSCIDMINWMCANKHLMKGTYSNIDCEKIQIETTKIKKVELMGTKILLTLEDGIVIRLLLNEEFQIGE